MRIRVVCADHAHGNVLLAMAARKRLAARATPGKRDWMGLLFITQIVYQVPAIVPGRDQTAPLPASSRGRSTRRVGAASLQKAYDAHGAVRLSRRVSG